MSQRILARVIISIFLLSTLIVSSPQAQSPTDEQLIAQMEEDLRLHADLIEDEWERTQIVDYFIERGEIDFALQLADKIDSAHNLSSVLWEIEWKFGESSDSTLLIPMISWAIAQVTSIDSPMERSKFISSIISHCKAYKKPTVLDSILHFAQQQAEYTDSYFYKAKMLTLLSEKYIEHHNHKKADSLLRNAINYLLQIDDPVNPEMDLPHNKIGTCWMGRYFDFQHLFDNMISNALRINPNHKSDSLIVLIFSSLHQCQHVYSEFSGAPQISMKAIEKILEYKDTDRVNSLLHHIGLETMKLPHTFGKRNTLDSLIQLVYHRGDLPAIHSYLDYLLLNYENIESARAKAIFLGSFSSIGTELYEKEPNTCNQIFIQAARKAIILDSAYFCTTVLYEVASDLRYVGIVDEADTALEFATNVVFYIEEPYLKAITLKQLAMESIECENTTRADSLLFHAAKTVMSDTNSERESFYHRNLFEEIVNLAANIENSNYYDSILHIPFGYSGEALSRHDHFGIIKTVFDHTIESKDSMKIEEVSNSALEIIEDLNQKERKVGILLETYKKYFNSQYDLIGDSLLAVSIKMTEELDRSEDKIEAYCEIANQYIEKKQFGIADSLLQLAIASIPFIDNGNVRYERQIVDETINTIFSLNDNKRIDYLSELLYDEMMQNPKDSFVVYFYEEMIYQINWIDDEPERHDSLLWVMFKWAEDNQSYELRSRLVSYLTYKSIDTFDSTVVESNLKLLPIIADSLQCEFCGSIILLRLTGYYSELEEGTKTKSFINQSYKKALEMKDSTYQYDIFQSLSFWMGRFGDIQVANSIVNAIKIPTQRVYAVYLFLSGYQVYLARNSQDG